MRSSHNRSNGLAFLFVNQYGLLPRARWLVGTVDTACPATGPTLALQQFLEGSSYAFCTGLVLFGIFDPADELVATERGQALPKIARCVICLNGSPHIIRQVVDGPFGQTFLHRRQD
ncbi:MAG: hypothetical protein ACI9KA_001881 [Parasphingorhabdus sp.]|jgi:hypothetical protein